MIDAKVLEAHFDTAFDAPNGIKKLRELILTLAMQGKLVPQDPKDEPASELLKKIEAEKKKLVKEGKIKASRGKAEKAEVNWPYELPKGWVWTRLGDALDVRDGTHDTPKYVENGYPLVTSKNIYTGQLLFDDVKYISKEDHLKICERSKVDNGDILFAMIGSIGNPVIVNCEFEFSIKNMALLKFTKPCVPLSEYVHYYLIQAQSKMKAIASGAVQSFVSLSFLRNYEFPLPPLAEQKRIVAKIDHLMARCDALEKMREERHAKRLAAHAAAIKDLLSPSATPRLRVQNELSPFAFLSTHFSEFYSVRENVAELRKAILQLAVMGKLVPQDPKDQPASELLKEIQREKARLVKEGKIKASRGDAENAEVKGPYELPKGWVWTRLSELAEIKTGKKDVNEGHENGKYPFFSCAAEPLKCNDYSYDCEALLMPGNGANVGQVLYYSGRFEAYQRTYIISDINYNNIFYIKRVVESRFSKSIEGKQYGSAINYIKIGNLTEFQIPLPPFAEQKRIVARIDQLMSLCDELEKQIDATTQKQTELLSSLVSAV